MRVTLKIDSATADEASAFVFAYQRTCKDTTALPVVSMAGIGWHITLPPIDAVRADAVMTDFLANID